VIVARLDRISRDVHFISGLMHQRAESPDPCSRPDHSGKLPSYSTIRESNRRWAGVGTHPRS
jgi:hypothetical protein